MTPREIVSALDRYIIGQDEAKRAVAIALRNRYRRSCLSPELREEITPKNIIMLGPTGVGKTEIARRLAKLVDAPFGAQHCGYNAVGLGGEVRRALGAHHHAAVALLHQLYGFVQCH